MYTNIRTGPALHCIGRFALDNEKHLTVPPADLMDALRLLMTNNVFQFGDTYWLHKTGTVMDRHQVPLGTKYYLASMKRQCLHISETDSNYIAVSSTTS